MSLPPNSDCFPRVEDRNRLGTMTRGTGHEFATNLHSLPAKMIRGTGDEFATNLRREGHGRLVKITRGIEEECACEDDKGYWRDICYK